MNRYVSGGLSLLQSNVDVNQMGRASPQKTLKYYRHNCWLRKTLHTHIPQQVNNSNTP